MTRYYITYCYTDKKRNVKKAHTFYDTESTLTETDLNELIKSITERNEYKRVVVENICYLGKDK